MKSRKVPRPEPAASMKIVAGGTTVATSAV